MPSGVTSALVSQLIYEEAGELLEDLDVFDVAFSSQGGWVTQEVEGDLSIPERSLGFRLRFRALERTLKDKEVDKLIGSILGRLEEELGVKPRR